MEFKKYYRFFPLVALIVAECVFFLLQIFDLSFRLGDGNAYWYMADVIGHGIFPYRNFFLADPPLFVLFLVPFVAIFRSHLVYLQCIPSTLEMIVAAGLFFFLRKEQIKLYWLAPFMYLFSFTILATSDYGTGLQLATCFVMGSLLAWQYKKYVLMGILLAAACLTKAYMAPIVIGILAYLVWSKKIDVLKKIIAGGVLASTLVIVPFILIAGKAFFQDVILHHLSRPEGIPKLSVLTYFFLREWPFLVSAGIGMYLKRQYWLVWPAVALAAFFVFFQDIYYAYLGSLWLFITIFSLLLLEYLWQKSEISKQIAHMLIFLLLFFLLFSTIFYWRGVRIEGKFQTTQEMAEKLEKLPGEYELYGTHETTPLVALLTHKRIFNNYIDTNTQTFASTINNKEEMSAAAIEHGVYLFTREATNLKNERISLHTGFFSDEIFKKACRKVAESENADREGKNEAIYLCKE